jgi:hypothetical protein
LNSSTYWASLDQSDAEDRKISAALALAGEDSFPDSFKAVDAASKSRTVVSEKKRDLADCAYGCGGRAGIPIEELGSLKRTEVAESWLKMVTFEKRIGRPKSWTHSDATLLESSGFFEFV